MRCAIFAFAVPTLLMLGLVLSPPAVAAQAESGSDDTEQLKKQLKILRDALKEELDRSAKLAREKKALQDAAAAAEIKARALVERTLKLEQTVAEQARELARLRGNTAPGAKPNPPDKQVKGQVDRVDDKTDLVSLNIGSDAGLAVGHTLEVYRLGAAPKYLGRLRIVSVRPRESVGRPIGKMLGTPKKGDQVSSNILGGR